MDETKQTDQGAAGQARYDALRQRFGENSARASDYLSERWFLRERAFVLRAVGDGAGTVLDIGCGSGLVTLPLVEAGRRVIGVDLNRAACRQAGRNGLQALCSDASDLPLEDATVEAAVMVEMAQQCSAEVVEQVLREVARVLRAGGRLVIVWSNRSAWVHRAAAFGLRVLARFQSSVRFDPSYHIHHIYHAPSRMRAAADRAGLALVEWFSIFPPWGMRLQGVDGPLVALIGSSFVAVFRKRSER